MNRGMRDINEVEHLRSRLAEAETENTYLKSLLDQAGISYDFHAALQSREADEHRNVADAGRMDSDQITFRSITDEMVQRFYSYFWGRTDVYSKRGVNKKTGKAGYHPQCDNFSRWDVNVCPRHSGQKMRCADCEFRAWTELKPAAIKRHLLGAEPDGSDVIGVYPLFPDGTCRFLVFDFDNHDKDAEDNLMRVISKEIAAELLEITFGKNNALMEID